MTIRHAVASIALAILLAGCAPAPCPGTECAPIGWFTPHYTCKCVAPTPPPPPPPPPLPPPAMRERRGG